MFIGEFLRRRLLALTIDWRCRTQSPSQLGDDPLLPSAHQLLRTYILVLLQLGRWKDCVAICRHLRSVSPDDALARSSEVRLQDPKRDSCGLGRRLARVCMRNLAWREFFYPLPAASPKPTSPFTFQSPCKSPLPSLFFPPLLHSVRLSCDSDKRIMPRPLWTSCWTVSRLPLVASGLLTKGSDWTMVCILGVCVERWCDSAHICGVSTSFADTRNGRMACRRQCSRRTRSNRNWLPMPPLFADAQAEIDRKLSLQKVHLHA